jgi:hypothetical protein
MARQTTNQHEPALSAGGENVVQFLGAAARGGSEFVPRRGSRLQGTLIRAPVPAVPHPRPGGPATVRPNPSVKPTHSGLRPPRAAYLNRSAMQIRMQTLLSGGSRIHHPRRTANALPALEVEACRRRTSTVSVGCPSFGGQRALGSCSTATACDCSPRRALSRRRSLENSPLQFVHRRTGKLGAGCPSFGGLRTIGCRSTTTVSAGRSFGRCCAVERFRVHGCGLYASAPRPHRPNPSFNLTFSGLRPPNAS